MPACWRRLWVTTLREVDIRESVTRHFADIGQDMECHDVTYENGQARERTQVLMDIANKENALVIGTGDMSELALGWATYNGDHMSMYGVNAGVPKTLVRHLVDYYADTCENRELTAVLKDVLDTPVSPELLPPVEGNIAQKTEDLVGLTNCMISSYIICFGADMHRTRSTGLQKRHFREDTVTIRLKMVEKFLPKILCPAILNGPACRTARRWEAWHCLPEETCGCRLTPVRGSGWSSWRKYKNIVKISSKFLIFCF